MRALLIVLILIFPSLPCMGAQVVVIGMGNFEPYFIAEGETGIFTDIVTAAFKRIPDYQPKYVFGLSNNQLLTVFDRDRLDAVANVFDSGALDACRSDPVFRFRDVAVSTQAAGLKIDTIADLAGHSVVTFEGAKGFFGPEFAAIINPHSYLEVGKPSLQARMLLGGRYDVTVGDLMIFLQSKSQFESQSQVQTKVVVHDIFPQIYSRMGFKDPVLCIAFNAALAELKASGEYEQIYERYISKYTTLAPPATSAP